MPEIGIGILGGGYMGKAHAVAMSSVGAIFGTALRPRLEMVCASSPASAGRTAYGFARATDDWRALVTDPQVEAIVIATPQETHRGIAQRPSSLASRCSAKSRWVPRSTTAPPWSPPPKPRVRSTWWASTTSAPRPANSHGSSSPKAKSATSPGSAANIPRTSTPIPRRRPPGAPLAWPTERWGTWRAHMINCALALMGPIARVMGVYETVHKTRPGGKVTNDDHAQLMCRFENGAIGQMYFSRVATGRKMGYAYEISGTKGAIRFDQEDQNALWLYRMHGPEATRGSTKILTGPAHPDYKSFCRGPGHGTGYQDQIIIEAKDFLTAIETGTPKWPTFRDGHEVNRVIAATLASADAGAWKDISDL